MKRLKLLVGDNASVRNIDGEFIKGYTRNNVVASSYMANQLKSLIEGGLITPDDVIECGKKFKRALND